MHNSTLITPQHLTRKAVIYIRQSTPHQVLNHQESLRLQYALHERARQLGWPAAAIDIIDDDLGLTAASAAHREGFNALVAQVTLAQVGLILSYDVTRLSRNCSDWYPLLDLCCYKVCLIADGDGIYDPATVNGRLLLGLKGTLSEWERHTMKARLTAGLIHKAERGALALQLPTGLVRNGQGKVHKIPNQEAQARLSLVFETFLQCRSASKVVEVFNTHNLLLPRRDRFGDLVWKAPRVAAVLAILKHPAYAGAFTYGRSRTLRREPTQGRPSITRLPQEQWRICILDVYPSYISWDTYLQIQAMLKDNHAAYDRNKTRGIPRPGKALLHGLVCCGECGHKMVVQYKGGTRYLCNFLRQQYHVPVCQNIPADAVDLQIVEAFFQALSPVELDVYARAVAAEQATDEQVAHVHQQHLQRLHYEAALTQRQFLRVDPDNRLVAAELERRWEMALAELKQAEEAHASRSTPLASLLPLSDDLQAAFQAVGQYLPMLWHQGVISQRHKKALLRSLIETVVMQRPSPEFVQARIVWRGGETTELMIPVPVGSLKDLAGAQAMEQIILQRSAQGATDELLAQELTAQGYRSPMHPYVLPSTVRSIRLRHRQFLVRHQSHPRRVAGSLTLTQLARELDITPHWIYDRINNGTIQITKDATTHLYLFPDEPATLDGFKLLIQGTVKTLNFSRGHQDA